MLNTQFITNTRVYGINDKVGYIFNLFAIVDVL